MWTSLLVFTVVVAQGVTTSPATISSAPDSRSPALAGELEARLELLHAACGYRVHERTWFHDLPADPGPVAVALASVRTRFLEQHTLPSCAELLERARALGPPRGSEVVDTPRERDLYVLSSPERVIEAYYNSADELDVTAIWTPDVLVTYNPGRHQIGFTLESAGQELLGMDELTFPCRMGFTLALPVRVESRAGDARERWIFERGDELAVVELEELLPVRALLVDRDQAVILSEFEYGRCAGGGRALAAARRTDVFRTTNGLQIQAAERALSAVDYARSPGRVEVSTQDNLFLMAASGGAEFRGRVGAREVPELVRPLIQAVESPRPAWKLVWKP